MSLKKDSSYFAIGIMSGSSLDGLDMVYCRFEKKENWSYQIIYKSVFKLGAWEEILRNASELASSELDILDVKFGIFIAQCISDFIEEKQINKIDIIASHGHTIYHFPEKGISKQIGKGEEIFKKIKIPTLYNLRQKDIDNGGNGAPIVPIGDLHLFSDYNYCLNLGGIANISIKNETSILAFDICVANQILNKLVAIKKLKYDNKGKIARKGKFNKRLFEALNQISFYCKKTAKSLDNSFSKKVLKIISQFELSLEDKLCSYCHHIAYQIDKSIDKTSAYKEEILITGGGAFNVFLIECIKTYLIKKNISVVIPSKEIVNNKEALIMAFMAVLYLRNENNCLASASGARQDSICGVLCAE